MKRFVLAFCLMHLSITVTSDADTHDNIRAIAELLLALKEDKYPQRNHLESQNIESSLRASQCKQKPKRPKNANSWKCLTCPKTMATLSAYIQHTRKHDSTRERFYCARCKTGYFNQKLLEQHKEGNSKRGACTIKKKRLQKNNNGPSPLLTFSAL